MPPYNRLSCGHRDVGNFSHMAVLLHEDGQDDHRDPRPKPTILSDMCVFTRLPRQVTFAGDKKTVHLMRGLGDFSNDEIQDCWYTETDFLTLKQETLSTLEIYKRSPESVDNVKYTMRGLEHHMEEFRNRRKLLRLVSRMIVFDNKDFSDGACQSKLEHVANLYSLASMDSVCTALSKAAQDQLEAQEYQRETSLELFNDEWIRCISSMGKIICHPENHEQILSVDGAKEDVSGFDDNWLCVPSGSTIRFRGSQVGCETNGANVMVS